MPEFRVTIYVDVEAENEAEAKEIVQGWDWQENGPTEVTYIDTEGPVEEIESV